MHCQVVYIDHQFTTCPSQENSSIAIAPSYQTSSATSQTPKLNMLGLTLLAGAAAFLAQGVVGEGVHFFNCYSMAGAAWPHTAISLVAVREWRFPRPLSLRIEVRMFVPGLIRDLSVLSSTAPTTRIAAAHHTSFPPAMSASCRTRPTSAPPTSGRRALPKAAPFPARA